jgi:hypothetical protein
MFKIYEFNTYFVTIMKSSEHSTTKVQCFFKTHENLVRPIVS